MKKYAPIALFTYNRPDHTHKVLESLKKNPESKHSDLFVFSDGFIDDCDKSKVEEVRFLLSNLVGFKSILVKKRIKNFGLAKNITNGINYVLRNHDMIIVIEDDIVTSKFFLNYMNKALVTYKNRKKVWHVAGWNYPICNSYLKQTFFSQVMTCWGWATWKNRWEVYEKKPLKLKRKLSAQQRHAFDLGGMNIYWKQVEKNIEGSLDTWAVFWYATIFLHQGVCLLPAKSLTKNIGFDGTGTNTGRRNNFNNDFSRKPISFYPKKVKENTVALDRIKLFLMKDKNPLFELSHITINLLKTFEEIKSKNQSIVIYGASNLAKLILPSIKDNVCMIVDSNSKLWGTKIGSFEVQNPSILKSIQSQILISAISNTKEITSYLENDLDIKKDRVLQLM